MRKVIALLLFVILTTVLILFNTIKSRNVILEKFQSANTKKIDKYLSTFDTITINADQRCLGIPCETYSFTKAYSNINIPKINSNNVTLSLFFSSNNVNNRQVIAHSNNWYLDIDDSNVKLVVNNIPLTSTIEIQNNTMYHLAITIGNGIANLYINGNKVSQDFGYAIKTTFIKLGLDKNKSYHFSGDMGGLIVRDKVERDVCQLYKSDTNYCNIMKCNFKPKGLNRMDCITECNKLNDCEQVECQEKCISCNNSNHCKWVDPLDTSKQDSYDIDLPDAPNPVRATPYKENGEILLDWSAPNANGGIIKSYTIVIYESFNKENGVNVRQLANSNCYQCEYLITGLKNQVYYDIGVVAINEAGASDISNIETIAPNGPLTSEEISPLLMTSDDEVNLDLQSKYPDVNPVKCRLKNKEMNDNHILGKPRKRLVESIREIMSE
jgi:hypothetical protein